MHLLTYQWALGVFPPLVNNAAKNIPVQVFVGQDSLERDTCKVMSERTKHKLPKCRAGEPCDHSLEVPSVLVSVRLRGAWQLPGKRSPRTEFHWRWRWSCMTPSWSEVPASLCLVPIRYERGGIAGSTGKVRPWVHIPALLLSDRMAVSVTSSARTWCPPLIMEIVKPAWMVVRNAVG